jgi:hypothetical protein
MSAAAPLSGATGIVAGEDALARQQFRSSDERLRREERAQQPERVSAAGREIEQESTAVDTFTIDLDA